MPMTASDPLRTLLSRDHCGAMSIASIARTIAISGLFVAGVAQAEMADVKIEEVRALERHFVLPRGAAPLQKYTRYYSTQIEDGRRYLQGYFILGAPDPPGIYLRESHPEIMDGGCGVVTLTYDLERHEFLGAGCNGVA